VPVTASSHDSLLQASRRLDWRFLLADPELGRVACLGSHDPELVESLRKGDVPPVFEHGDLSHPNLIWLEDGRVGVVDWELAEEKGLPLRDLAFFLAYATFALRRPRTAEEHVTAFHDAFFGSGGWSRPRIVAYAGKLGLDEAVLTPLFVACWARYTAPLARRIAGGPAGLTEQVAAWVRGNRYHALWRHTIAHADEVAWQRR
jgi:hypothetical protein